MNRELSYKIYKSVEVSISTGSGIDGLTRMIESILYYEIKTFADEIMEHEKLDCATMSYQARHNYRRGYAKRHKEIHEAILKALKERKPDTIKKTAQLPQITEDIPHSPSVETSGGGEQEAPKDTIT